MRSTKFRIFLLPIVLLVYHLVFSVSALAENLENTSEENIAEALFTTGIEDRQPVDQVLVLTNDIKKIYFYSDIRYLSGKTIIHRWEYEGNLVSVKNFDVGGARWRVYSQKILNPEMTGTWTVTVQDENGWALYTEQFMYIGVNDKNMRKAILPWSE